MLEKHIAVMRYITAFISALSFMLFGMFWIASGIAVYGLFAAASAVFCALIVMKLRAKPKQR